MPRLSKIGAAALAAFGWTTGAAAVSASYLQVAGGGGGGFIAGGNRGAGGGAGGFLTGTVSLNPTQSYTVTVGAGGSALTNGSNSQFGTLTASVGGGAGGSQNGASSVVGQNGGSGGGGPSQSGSGSTAGGTGTAGQGNDGAAGSNVSGQPYGCGGGGGAGAVGTLSNNPAGAGGVGLANPITGSTTGQLSGGIYYLAGGGGGGTYAAGGGVGGAGGLGGGGLGGGTTSANGVSGTANTGGGGGGAEYSSSAGASGGSGVVIISYVGAQQFGGGVVTSSGGNTIHTFTTSGTLSPLSSLTASTLVVAGGGGGGANGGGGGAGGYRTGSGITLDTNSIYLVTVGAGGIRGIQGTQYPTSGSNSVFNAITSTGGGYGADGATGTNRAGGDGGSGGGGFFSFAAGNGNTPSTSPSQGNNGGAGSSSSAYGFGGGGGASAVGVAGTTTTGGNGGAGLANPITGSTAGQLVSGTYYLAGGGGGGIYFANTPGSGGAGGGGGGGNNGSAGTAGTANTGGGGGGGGSNGSNNPDGGEGGSGIVIISYPGSTQQMAGGTVTVAGGNVIHTFTSSGYLTPIVLVNNSLRFRGSSWLNRTPTVSGSGTTFTWSGWIKRGLLGGANLMTLYSAGTGDAALGVLYFDNSTNKLSFLNYNGAYNWNIVGTPAYRDPSAWYHIVAVVDTTQATSSNRIRLYVNGVEITAFDTASYPSLSYSTPFFNQSGIAQFIGRWGTWNANHIYDGYMTEINFIDGQALTPNSFGTSNGLGVWQPIRYGGSYGTNGFYLPFTNTTSTTTLGYDFSPQGNNWTTNNFSLTAGTTYDSMTDVPTLTSATAANYATINPLDYNSTYLTLSAANLQQTYAGVAAAAASRATMAIPTTGKYYWEVYINATGGGSGERIRVGITRPTTDISGNSIDNSATSYLQMSNGQKRNNSTDSTYGSGFSATQIIQVLYDATAGAIYFGQNDSYANGTGNFNQTFSTATAAFTGLSGEFMPCFITYGGADIAVNFGQRPFTYTPPTGFVALNTFNLTTPTIGATASTIANKYFDISLYTGNGSTQSITNAGSFQPDFVWMKSRSPNGYQHVLQDVIRGTGQTKKLYSSLSEEENGANAPFGYLSSFDSNGFSVSIGSTNANQTNASSQTYVGWQWKANGAGVTNTAGSINSTVSSNTATGFSIVTYTGNATSGSTVGHGCQVGGVATAPNMIILKSRSLSTNWYVYNSNLTSASYQMYLNLPDKEDNAVTTAFNSVAPGATTFTLPGTGLGSNNSGATYVAYCFAAVPGYSAFGSYTGNGVPDGTFVYTGFRPRFILIKASSFSTASTVWTIFDTSRSPYNASVLELYPNDSISEQTDSNGIDILSNGFKPRRNSEYANSSGQTYIYAAFAENPFKYANAR